MQIYICVCIYIYVYIYTIKYNLNKETTFGTPEKKLYNCYIAVIGQVLNKKT